MTQKKQFGKVDVEALLAKRDKISSAAIKNALDKMQEAQQKALEEKLIENLSNVQRCTLAAVDMLRYARTHEKKVKTYLVAVAAAEQQFLNDADYSAYEVAYNTALKEYNK